MTSFSRTGAAGVLAAGLGLAIIALGTAPAAAQTRPAATSRAAASRPASTRSDAVGAASAPAIQYVDGKVWNSDIHDPQDADAGGAPAIHIVAARNGVYSGKVVVGGGTGVRAAVGDLRQGSAVIPASAIRVRYATPWDGNLAGGSEARGTDILWDAPPGEPGGNERITAGRVPVWVTVRVPRDARPGDYAGELTVTAAKAGTVKVPVTVKVHDWVVPSPDDYRTWVELMESPDTLAAEYGVAPWSDRHFELISQSLKYVGEVGSRVLYVPLIEHTNAGNEQSMVRWREGPEGKADFDFSVMDKYLDAAERNMGKPRVVVFNVWDRYLTRPGAGGRDFQTQTGLRVAATGPLVTMVDPAGGKTRTALLPDFPLRESVVIAVDRTRRGVTAQQHLENRLAELKEGVTDFREGEKGEATVNGRQGKWTTFTCRMGPFAMKALVYMVLEESRAITLMCLATPEKFDAARPAFEKIAATLKMTERELTMDCPPGWEKTEFQYRDTGIGTGTVGIVWGPGDGAAGANAVMDAWKSLFSQLRQRMKSRGLEQAMMLGMVSDFWATKDQTAFLKEASGNLPWANASHYFFRRQLQDLADVKYHSFYFGVRFGYQASLYGWKRPELALTFDRAAFLDSWPLARWRHMAEYSITGNTRGVGRLGADTWNVLRDKNGARRGRAYQRYPESDWGYLNVRASLLAPGAAGVLGTARYEVLREGIQDCEARIAIEKALTDYGLSARLGADLTKRCEAALSRRLESMWFAVAGGVPKDDTWRKDPHPDGQAWFLASDWRARSGLLYGLAGEVAAKTAAK